MAGSEKPLYAFISPCGWGNLGDAAIVDSLIHGINARVPGASIVGFTLKPADTRRRHAVARAGDLTTFSLPFFPMVSEDCAPESFTGTTSIDGRSADQSLVDITDAINRTDLALAREASSGPPYRACRVLNRLRSSSGIAFVLAVSRIWREPRALRLVRRDLVGLEAVVVAGGGQLDARFGGLFGQPYVLWRWRRTARDTGARYLVLSVGTGKLGRASRWLTVRALRHADYRSYRDPASRDMLAAPKMTSCDPVVPDLAYALPLDPQPLRKRSRPVVGISPMNYQHPDYYPRGSQDRYERHLRVIETICERLLDDGCDLIVFITDLSDEVARDDLLDRLVKHHNRQNGSTISVSIADTVEGLWRTYAHVDVAVTTRLHAALLGHVAHRPVLALAHEPKVRAHMAAIGHERFCFDPMRLDLAEATVRLRELVSDRKELSVQIADSVSQRRAKVEAQYDEVFGSRSLGDSDRKS